MSSAQPREPDPAPAQPPSADDFNTLSGPPTPQGGPGRGGQAKLLPVTVPKPAVLRKAILETLPKDVIVGSIEPIALRVGAGSVTVVQLTVSYQDNAEIAFSSWRQKFELQTGLRIAVNRNSGHRYVERSLEQLADHGRILTNDNLPALKAIIDHAYNRDLNPTAPVTKSHSPLVDLRAVPFVTIDGAYTRNMEDAVAAVSHADGTTSLYIAIIDVTGFVPPGSPHRPYLSGRGGALYTVHDSYPLLGTQYSYTEGSLLQGQERPAWVFEVKFNQQMEVIGRECTHALIVNHLRLTPEVVNQPAVYTGTLIAPIAHCALALKQDRLKSPRLVTQHLDAGEIVTECMTQLNLEMGRLFKEHNLPGIFSIQSAPTYPQKLRLAHRIRAAGVAAHPDDFNHQESFIRIWDGLRQLGRESLLQDLVGRFMQRSLYEGDPSPHQGIPAAHYLRIKGDRYPGIVNQWQLASLIEGRSPHLTPMEVQGIAEKQNVRFRNEASMALHVSTLSALHDLLTRVGEEFTIIPDKQLSPGTYTASVEGPGPLPRAIVNAPVTLPLGNPVKAALVGYDRVNHNLLFTITLSELAPDGTA